MAHRLSLMDITLRPDVCFTEGHGSWLRDSTGKHYLDFVQGWAVNCLGHSPKVVTDTLSTQSRKLLSPGPGFYNDQAIHLASLLCELSCFDKVFFTNSGAEANEGAIKLARKWGKVHKNGAYEIITFHNGFHGRTLATMSASAKEGWSSMFAPQVPGFKYAHLHNMESVLQLVNDSTVAILIEPIQGEGGVIPVDVDFMCQLSGLCKTEKLLFMVDEVQTGMGRTGNLFGYQESGITPDIMSLGKGMGGGVPLGASLCRQEVFCFEHGEQGGTFNGNPLMTAVGNAILGVISARSFLQGVKERGLYLSKRLQEFSDEFKLLGTRGRGLLQALLLPYDIGPKLVEIAREIHPDGLLINAVRPSVIRFMPSLQVSVSEIELMLDILRIAMRQLRSEPSH